MKHCNVQPRGHGLRVRIRRGLGGRAHVGAGGSAWRWLRRPTNFETLGRAGDHQRALVVGLMTAKAQQHDIRSLMSAAVGAVHDMVKLEPASRAAAMDAATTTIATPHQARDARCDILIRARGYRVVERADVLRVARGALDRSRTDRNARSSAFLPALPTALAHGHGNSRLGTLAAR